MRLEIGGESAFEKVTRFARTPTIEEQPSKSHRALRRAGFRAVTAEAGSRLAKQPLRRGVTTGCRERHAARRAALPPISERRE